MTYLKDAAFDWDLVAKGDKVERERVARNYIKLAYRIGNRYGSSLEESERLSLCHLGLVRAFKGFDPSKASFSTWMAKCVQHEVWLHTRAMRAQSRCPILNPISLEVSLAPGEEGLRLEDALIDETASIETLVEEAATLEWARHILSTTPLATEERWVMYLAIYDGISQIEIGRELNISQAQVSRTMARAKTKLRQRASRELA